jgi:hypothetical protein
MDWEPYTPILHLECTPLSNLYHAAAPNPQCRPDLSTMTFMNFLQ